METSEKNITTEQEGVVKFKLEFKSAPPLAVDQVKDLIRWRDHFKKLGLMGQSPERYEGLGFGNLSRRFSTDDVAARRNNFLVTGTQTGALSRLAPEHFSLVTACDPAQNLLTAEGPIEPSSEAMTHGVIYDMSPSTRWILHGHSPEIWQNASPLRLSITDRSAAYGTPELAAEVKRLFARGPIAQPFLFVMGGHQDGMLCFGRTPDEIAALVQTVLAQAKQRR